MLDLVSFYRRQGIGPWGVHCVRIKTMRRISLQSVGEMLLKSQCVDDGLLLGFKIVLVSPDFGICLFDSIPQSTTQFILLFGAFGRILPDLLDPDFRLLDSSAQFCHLPLAGPSFDIVRITWRVVLTPFHFHRRP
jgi:hypothetical protein